MVRTENTTCRWIFLDISFNLTLTRTVAGCRKTCIQRDKGQRQWRYLKLPNGRQTHLVFRALPPAKPVGLVALVDVDSDPHSLRGWSNTDSFPNSNPFRPTRSDTPMTGKKKTDSWWAQGSTCCNQVKQTHHVEEHEANISSMKDASPSGDRSGKLSKVVDESAIGLSRLSVVFCEASIRARHHVQSNNSLSGGPIRRVCIRWDWKQCQEFCGGRSPELCGRPFDKSSFC